MSMTQAERVRDRMTFEEVCGIWIVAVLRTNWLARAGLYSALSSDGRIMPQVRVAYIYCPLSSIPEN